MNKALFFLIATAFFSCNSAEENLPESDAAESETRSEMENVPAGSAVVENVQLESYDWLLGSWMRIDNDKEKKTFENWIKESDERYLGHGFVMSKADTVWQEKMLLSYNNSNWTFEVQTPGNDDAVSFSLMQYNSTTFTVENAKHDFPKYIKYWKNLDKLNAVVTGDDQELFYEFKRLN